jgi:hypothetical protein
LSTKFSAEGFEADQRWMWLYTTSDRRSPDVGELRDRFQFEDGVDFGFEYLTAAVEQQSKAGLAVGTLLASVLGSQLLEEIKLVFALTSGRLGLTPRR